jgi:hypothetical protein
VRRFGYRLERRLAALWVAVVCVALGDAAARGQDSAASYNRRAARSWLSTASPDLSFVLSACGIDLGYWLERCVPRLEARWRAIDQAQPLARRRTKPGEGSRRRAEASIAA